MRYLRLAEKYNLLISGGSDYHGENIKPRVKIGIVSQDNKTITKYNVKKFIKLG